MLVPKKEQTRCSRTSLHDDNTACEQVPNVRADLMRRCRCTKDAQCIDCGCPLNKKDYYSRNNRFEYISLLTTSATLLAGVAFYGESMSQSIIWGMRAETLLGFVLLAANVFVLFLFAWRIFTEKAPMAKKEVVKRMQSIRRYRSSKSAPPASSMEEALELDEVDSDEGPADADDGAASAGVIALQPLGLKRGMPKRTRAAVPALESDD